MVSPHGFDAAALFEAVDERRQAEGLSWAGVTTAIWDESCDLNAQRGDHPISPDTIKHIGIRRDTSCQHALFVLRWLGRAPEEFIASPRVAGVALPYADPAHRLRWDLRATYDALNAARTARGATWAQAATRLHCTSNQLTGLRTAKFGASMRLMMRITQALGRPAADFVSVATW
ncbi:hypothetical protein [Jatrophihabitans sp.]|uniref:hypothetical protein n=1 Tax=Jatrophihabitans sp. TaxID=1932789 RepID=UPI0030C66753|nr:hypothetical protein [Jatrophihabitans sp.]